MFLGAVLHQETYLPNLLIRIYHEFKKDYVKALLVSWMNVLGFEDITMIKTKHRVDIWLMINGAGHQFFTS